MPRKKKIEGQGEKPAERGSAMDAEPLRLEHPEQLPNRRPLDKYRTPSFCTAALIESYPEIRGDLFVDPCAGDCRMRDAMSAALRFPDWLTNDIDVEERSVMGHCDATSPDFWALAAGAAHQKRAWVVTNPPFLLATSIALQAIETVGNVALLLRSTWLEPAKDRQWLGRMPPRAMLVLPRFSFIGGGSDQAGCHWMLWGDVEPGIKVWTGKPGQLQLFGGGQ